VYIIDSSAILSGKPLPIDQQDCRTVEEIADEFSVGGSSYRMFQYLCEKGLSLHRPSDSSKKKVQTITEKMGESLRLSSADKAVLALAVDVESIAEKKAVILTDDYSIQNIANVLKICFQPISQTGITKTFKWNRCCRGCGRLLSNEEMVCPICGSSAKFVVNKKAKNKKKK
jgi:endoribonuclease Nob1